MHYYLLGKIVYILPAKGKFLQGSMDINIVNISFNFIAMMLGLQNMKFDSENTYLG